MAEAAVRREKEAVLAKIRAKEAAGESAGSSSSSAAAEAEAGPGKRPRGWDDGEAEAGAASAAAAAAMTEHFTRAGESSSSSSSAGDAAEAAPPRTRKSRWSDDAAAPAAAPAAGPAGRKRSRWSSGHDTAAALDQTPAAGSSPLGATPVAGALLGETPAAGALGLASMATPTPSALQAAAAAVATAGAAAPRTRFEREIEERNRPMSDAELDALLPGEDDGYAVVAPPSDYRPLMTPMRKLMATPTPAAGSDGFRMTSTPAAEDYGIPLPGGASATSALSAEEVPAGQTAAGADLPPIRPEEAHLFGALLDRSARDDEDDDLAAAKEEAAAEEARERAAEGGKTAAEAAKAASDAAARSRRQRAERRRDVTISSALLRIKAGDPSQRKSSMRLLTTGARELGAGPLFDHLLPMLMSDTLEDYERHMLVKVVDRVLYRLDDLVRPHVRRILTVIVPMLIDADYYARTEAREIVSNLAKAAGMSAMITTMRPDIDHEEDYVRNTTARALAVVASALGVPAMLPFLRAVCGSKKSWLARHTGCKVIHQIAVLMGCGVLPFVRDLVACVAPCLEDEKLKVRSMTALAVAGLAEASHPYGIEAFDPVLRPLWHGVSQHRGKALAAFLKAIGFVIPLMDARYAAYATREVMPTLQREFATPDDDMRKVVLRALRQCVGTDGVTPAFLREGVMDSFFASFWQRRLALDSRNAAAVVETTAALAAKVGAADVLSRVVDDLKDESEPYRRMVMRCVNRVVTDLGADDVDGRLEERLVDGVLFAFQEQGAAAGSESTKREQLEAMVVMDGFSTVMRALGKRAKPYMRQVAALIKHRLNMASPDARMQAADLCERVAPAMRLTGEESLLAHLGTVMYECLGEEYPDVLGSVLGALRSIATVLGMEALEPGAGEMLPRLTPILRNRSIKVQQNCIELVGRIADRGSHLVTNAEWMRVCFQLIELLRAPRKAIRRATVNTFGYIAKAVGPQDVLVTLLDNLRVAERTSRVCSTIAMAIVAETCQPFTVIPALMSEYRVPEINVQNGVLKALSFLFQYIGELGADYVYAVTPLVEDALTDRDMVHRQTACAIVKHMALGVRGMGREDALTHLLNFIWPNVFQTNPHMLSAVLEAVEALRVGLGAHRVLQYTLQGLYHPSRQVREVFWQIYNNLYLCAADELTPYYPRVPAPPSVMDFAAKAEAARRREAEGDAPAADAAASASSSGAAAPDGPARLPEGAARASAMGALVDKEASLAAAEAGLVRRGEDEAAADLEERLWRSPYRRTFLDVVL